MFPEQTLAAQPKLIMIYAWTLLATGKYKEAEECLQTIENNLNIKAEEAAVAGLANLDPELRGALIEVMVVRSVISISQFNIQQTLDLCQVVLPYLDDNLHPHLFNEPLSMRTVVVFNMGLAYEFSGEVGKAADALREAVSLSLEQENFNILPMAMAHLGQLQILQGHLYHAQKTYRQGLDMSTGETGIASPVAGIAEIGMGNLMYEWNDLDLARNHFTAGINLAKRWNHAESLLAGYTGLVRIKQAQGDLASAVKLLEELADMLKDLGAHIFLPIVDTSFARIWISQGDLSAANRWLQSSGIGVDSSLSFLQEYDYLTLIRLLIAQRRWDEASRLIRRLLSFF